MAQIPDYGQDFICYLQNCAMHNISKIARAAHAQHKQISRTAHAQHKQIYRTEHTQHKTGFQNCACATSADV